MKAGHEEEYADGTSAVPWPQSDGVTPDTLPALDSRRCENGEAQGGAKSNNGAQPVGRSPAGGREEGLDRPGKDEDDGFLSACDQLLSNEGPDLWGFGQSEGKSGDPVRDTSVLSSGRSPMADSAYHTRLEDDTLTKDRDETALKVLSTMSQGEVQERLNAEDLSTPIVSVKLKTLVEKKAIWEKHVLPKADHLRPLTKKKLHTCLWIKNRRRRISALVDTGSELGKKMRTFAAVDI